MPTATAPVTAAQTTVLTAPRQSSQLLQLLRSVLQGSTRELRRYLARGGDPKARVYLARRDGSCYVSSEEYRGPGRLTNVPLLTACYCNGRGDQVSLLIDAGADPDSDAGTGSSPMCAAAADGDIATMALLQSKGARVDCEGATPLMAASEHGKLEATKWLVGQGADVATQALAPPSFGEPAPTSAMLYAAACGYVDIMRFLHAQGAPFIAEAAGLKDTALHQAASTGQSACVRFILACGFAVNTRDTLGATALHTASRSGHQAVIEQLLDSGAAIEAKDASDNTPLRHAMADNASAAACLLVARGAVIADGRAAYCGVIKGSIAALEALMTSSRWLAMSRLERLRVESSLLNFVNDVPTLNALRRLVGHMSALVKLRCSEGNNALHMAAHLAKQCH